VAKMTGGQALVRSLKQYDIDTIFGLPGVQLDNTFDALYEEQDAIKVLHTRHEQATAYMAFGYAASTGKVGTCLVVPGPGLLNATAALSTAYACNAPVLCLSGQIQSDLIEKGLGMLHEIPNQLQMIRSVTKWAARANHPTEVPELIREAFKQLQTGRIRPVEFEMAPDIMGLEADVELLDPVTSYPEQEPDPDAIRAAAELLANAKNPVIFAGGGTLDAGEELLNLAETLQAPVVMSSSGRGSISDHHYLAQNMVGGQELWVDADVVLAVGTRFTQPLTRWGIDDSVKVIRMDVDPEEIERVSKPAVGIVTGAKTGLGQLANSVSTLGGKRASRKDELEALKEKVADMLFEVQPQASYAEVLREELPDDGIMVSEMTQMGYFSSVGFPVYNPRTFVNAGYQGTLGFGYATALGVQVAHPDKKVISINGDGGFMFTVQELSTAVRHNIPLVAIVFSDGAYGNVRRIQKESYGGRTIASDLLNPDFQKLADAFGVAPFRAETPEALRSAITEAYDIDGPSLIEVPIGEVPGMGNMLWRTPPARQNR
jgi:acetolactate synthase I/II/III large subunit